MVEENISRTINIIDAIFKALTEILKRVDVKELEEQDPNPLILQLSKPMLSAAGITIESLEISKELVLRDYSKEQRKKEIVKVFKIEEIRPNTRLLIETRSKTEYFELHLTHVYFINENQEAALEDFRIETTLIPSWDEKIRKDLEKLEPYLRRIISYAIVRIIEEIIKLVASTK